ncbi:unnamed protein product [Closterium sp. NIES-53]
MALRWYCLPVLTGSMRVSIDLCAALSGASDTSGSSNGGSSGSGGGGGGGGSSSSSGDSSGGSSGVTDPASPSFGQLFVGFTSAALTAPPGRLPSPVTLSSWTFRFTGKGEAKGRNGGGGGGGKRKGSKARALPPSSSPPGPSSLQSFPFPLLPFPLTSTSSLFPLSPPLSFSIPLPFAPMSPSPAPLSHFPTIPFPPAPSTDSFTCRHFPRNPCAPGVCIDDIDGTYSCLCPSPFFPFVFYPKGTARCYQLRSFELRVPTFLSPYGLTCPLILNTYGLTQSAFFRQNKGFKCRAPIPVETLVNVTSRAFSQCTSMYTANYGDSCDSLNALFSTRLQSLNPALSCSDGPRPGQVGAEGADGCR